MQILNKLLNGRGADEEDGKEEKQSGFDDIKFKKHKFGRTKLASCIISPTEDEEATLTIDTKGMESLQNHFNNCICLIGPPGVGKSTLASSMYNAMRNDKYEYFEISNDSMMSFTRGIWALNENIKVSELAKDKIDILDVEGIDDDDVIHYLVLVGMALSKSILLCASYDSNPRFQFSLFKILETGFNLFKKYDIRLPKPVIYIQVPFGKNKFGVGRKMVDKNGLFDIIKNKYQNMNEFEFRIFSLPRFEQNNRFNNQFLKYVNELINEIKDIPSGPNMKERVQYAKTVANALNNNSPQMVTNINLKFFENELKTRSNLTKCQSQETMKQVFGSLKLKSSKTTYEEFIKLGTNNDNGLWKISGNFIETAKALSYYDCNDKRHLTLIEKYSLSINFIDPRPHCKDDYQNAKDRLKAIMQAKGDQLIITYNKHYQSFIKLKISEYVNKIKFKQSTYLPYQLRHDANNEKLKYEQKLIQSTENMIKIPDDFLALPSLETEWKAAESRLNTNWNTQISQAKVDRKIVRTSGNHKCPSCNNNHEPGVGHKKCGKNARWLWVDPATNYCICDTCYELKPITSVCCWSCSTRLLAQIVVEY